MLRIDIRDKGSFQQLSKVLQGLPYDVQKWIAFPALRVGAGVIIRAAKKGITFRRRRGSLGLAGTFRIVANKRTNRVYANYGGVRHRHAHLIEFGTKQRPKRGAVKPHGILRKAFIRNENNVIYMIAKQLQKDINKFVRDTNKGTAMRGLKTVLNRVARKQAGV